MSDKEVGTITIHNDNGLQIFQTVQPAYLIRIPHLRFDAGR